MPRQQRLPHRAYPKRQDSVSHDFTSQKHHPADVRRARRAAAHLEAHVGADDVPLHLRVYLEDGRHRGRRDGAAGDLLVVLRPAVFGAASDALCAHAGRQDVAPQRRRLAAQHGLGRCRRHQGGKALLVRVPFFTTSKTLNETLTTMMCVQAQVYPGHPRRHPLGRVGQGRLRRLRDL